MELAQPLTAVQRTLVLAVALCGCANPACAQWTKDSLVVSGFATQSLVFTTGNNYLGMNTTDGSPAWTEGAVNVNDRLTSKIRVGAQVHVTRLGAFGGYTPTLDWALVDYSAGKLIKFRAGKLRINWGLFNNIQDVDPAYLWALLPEGEYGIDVRATNLYQRGAELYGRIPLSKPLGNLDYSVFYGYYRYASNDGYNALFQQQGLNFQHQPKGKTPGFDLHWNSPLPGLKVGGSLLVYDAHANLPTGTYTQPSAYWPIGYAEYTHEKWYAAAEYSRLGQYQTVTLAETGPVTSVVDTRTWFVMGAYHVTPKLQLGSYYTRYTVPSAGDNTDPANYFTDKVVSSRYDFTSNLYGKLEGHFIRGNAVGFYTFNNPDGLQPHTNGLVAKVGVSF